MKITYKGETKNIPKKYLPDSLKGKDRQKQIKSLFEKKDRPKVKLKSKKSSWVVKFDKKYKLKNKSMASISKATGIPLPALKLVYKKGEGAYYSAGSRPNQTKDSWARARMYSYILGGPVRKIDKHITEKYNVVF
tara:strand:- start:3028 stop:3432 length:405 start_codon:yes stop_codon:yes gene_type:complete